MKISAWLTTVFMTCLAFSTQGCSMEPDEDEVRIEIKQKVSEAEAKRLGKKLQGIQGGSIMTQTYAGKVTFIIGGVTDVKAFASRIKFAQVVEVREAERTLVLSTGMKVKIYF